MENDIVDRVLNNKRYAGIDHDVVLRIYQENKVKYKKEKEVIKATRAALHVMHESFLLGNCHSVVRLELSEYSGLALISDKDFSKKLMGHHASTKERLKYIEDIYSYIGQYITYTDSVCDIGCGFNPFSIPYFCEKPTVYYACDINFETVDLLNTYFSMIGKDSYKAFVLDAITVNPNVLCNIALFLKLFPILEQQKKGRSFELLGNTIFDRAIISFPIKSLSGKEKGMQHYYSNFFETGLPKSLSIIDQRIIGNEMFYIVKKQ